MHNQIRVVIHNKAGNLEGIRCANNLSVELKTKRFLKSLFSCDILFTISKLIMDGKVSADEPLAL